MDLENVVLSGGEHGGEIILLSAFTQLGPHKFFVSEDGYQYRLTAEVDNEGRKQAVFVAKVF